MPDLDLDLLADDLADAIDRGDYPLDVAASDIRPHLEGFITAITGVPSETR
jgi:hypothetical protein